MELIHALLHIPSKPHTDHLSIRFLFNPTDCFENRISRKLRFLDTFAPQSYPYIHPCPAAQVLRPFLHVRIRFSPLLDKLATD
jgi:hypothetical protein